MSEKVAILGRRLSVMDAPFDDESFEIWGVNDVFTMIPRERSTRWFAMHRLERIPPCDLGWMVGQAIPVYMLETTPEVPLSVAYPLRPVIHFFKSSYFTSSIAYALALAGFEQFKEIHLYGVEMDREKEIANERPCIEYWIGRLEERGVKIWIHPNSSLMTHGGLYGYQELTNGESISQPHGDDGAGGGNVGRPLHLRHEDRRGSRVEHDGPNCLSSV